MSDIYGRCNHCGGNLTNGHICPGVPPKPDLSVGMKRAEWRYNISEQIEAARIRASALGAEIVDPQVGAIEALLEERKFQDAKHGSLDRHGHTIGEWILIMESELAEAKVALIKGGEGRDSVLSEITQVAAVGLACIEQHGTREIKGRAI